ncbi:MAG: hypothetical protein ACT4P9_03580 [Betaproteobacteria bacterium]
MRYIFTLACWLVLLPSAAVADYARGKAAYDAWDMAQAVQLLGQSLESDVRSAKLLADIYALGYAGLVEERDSKRRSALQAAIRLGDSAAKYDLGRVEIFGAGPNTQRGNWTAGVPLLQQACQEGTPDACQLLVQLAAGEMRLPGVAVPEHLVNQDDSRRYAKLWSKAVLDRLRNGGGGHGVISLAVSAGKPWSALSVEEGAAYFVLLAILRGEEQQRMQQADWPLPFTGFTSEMRAEARVRASRLMAELGVRGPERSTEAPRRMVQRIASDWTKEERLTREVIDLSARYMAALGYQHRSPKLFGHGDPVAKFELLASELTPLTEEFFRDLEKVRKEKRLDRESYLIAELAKRLSPEHIESLHRFLQSEPGRKYLEFRRQLALVIAQSATIALGVAYGPASGPQRGAVERLKEHYLQKGIPFEIDRNDRAAQVRSQFVNEEAAWISRVRSLGGRMLVSAALPLAFEPYQRMSRMLSPSEIGEVKVFKYGGAWRAFMSVQGALEEARQKESALRMLEERFRYLVDALYAGKELSRARKELEHPYRLYNADQFAARLYELSPFAQTPERTADLVQAEVALIANRWLAEKLRAERFSPPAGAPRGWQAMAAGLRRAIEPIAASHIAEREKVLRASQLDGKEANLYQYKRAIMGTRDRGVRFADGRDSRETELYKDIPDILAFYDTPAAAKWRRLWPELRACAARLAALHVQLDADPDLAGGKRAEQVAKLTRAAEGGTLSRADWTAMGAGRLGLTLSGMHRFPLPLGTTLMPGPLPERAAKIDGSGNDIVISTYASGPGLAFELMDQRCEHAVTNRPSPAEVEQIDVALTATFDKSKDRWFAAMEVDWEVFADQARRIQSHPGYQAIRTAFKVQAEAAMERLWRSW